MLAIIAIKEYTKIKLRLRNILQTKLLPSLSAIALTLQMQSNTFISSVSQDHIGELLG